MTFYGFGINNYILTPYWYHHKGDDLFYCNKTFLMLVYFKMYSQVSSTKEILYLHEPVGLKISQMSDT